MEFIVKASGIKQRFAYVKEGILDIGRMRPFIPERPEEALSDQAAIALHAARDAIKSAGKRPGDIDAVVVSCAYTQRSYPAIAIEVQNELGIKGFAFDMLVLSEPYKAGPLEVIFTIKATSRIGMLKTRRSKQLKKISKSLFI